MSSPGAPGLHHNNWQPGWLHHNQITGLGNRMCWQRLILSGCIAPFAAAWLAVCTAGCHRANVEVQKDKKTAGAPSSLSHPGSAVPASASTSVDVHHFGFGLGGIPLAYDATYVGAKACAACHDQQCAAQQTHHMAHTAAIISAANQAQLFSAERLGRPFANQPDAAPCLSRYEKLDGDIALVANPGSNTPQETGKVSAVLGSLNNAMTPITFLDGRRLRELPVTYSPKQDAWIITPGQKSEATPPGRIYSAEGTHRCLSCHGTYVSWRDDRIDAPASLLGIDCERCHGPGSEHVKSMEQGAKELSIFNAGKLPANQQVQFCGQCHRTPADAWPVEVLQDDKEIARHAGTAMMLSACYRQSPPESTLSCLECHNPHQNIDRTKDNSNRSCLRCHSSPGERHTSDKFTTEKITASSDCVSCHMQRVKNVIAGVDFSNHWIRTPTKSSILPRAAWPEYLDYLEDRQWARLREPLGPERHFAANLRLAEALTNRGKLDEALEVYRGMFTPADFGVVWVGLAKALVESGNVGEGVAQYRAALREYPENVEATQALAWILATVDDPALRNGKEAVELSEALRKRTETKAPVLLDTLAAAYAEAGRFAEAVKTAEQAQTIAADAKVAQSVGERIALYKQGKPWRDKSLTMHAKQPLTVHLNISSP